MNRNDGMKNRRDFVARDCADGSIRESGEDGQHIVLLDIVADMHQR